MQTFLETDYTIPKEFFGLLVILSLIIFGRYLLLSLGYQELIYKVVAKQLPKRIISPLYSKGQRNQEIMWSAISAILFGVIGILMIMAWQNSWTKIYTELEYYPLWYIPISFIAAMLIHETYYYWLHRWMHSAPKIYRAVHKIHHQSIDTSVWTSFSFHPIESVLQAIIIPVILLVIPMHWIVIIVWLILMTISAIINHAGVEIYPSSWNRNVVARWLIGSTHHDLHHRRFTKNFGLYFTFWDILMGTESAEFEDNWNKATDHS